MWFSFHFTRYLYDVSLLPTLQVNTEKYILVVNVSYRTQRCASIVSNALDKQPLARFHIYHSAWIIYHGLVIGRTEVPLLAHSILRRDLDRIPKTIKHLYNLPLYTFDSPLSLHHCSSNEASATSLFFPSSAAHSRLRHRLPSPHYLSQTQALYSQVGLLAGPADWPPPRAARAACHTVTEDRPPPPRIKEATIQITHAAPGSRRPTAPGPGSVTARRAR